MIKEIQYNGYSANPSDYESTDGDLSTVIGMVQENGAMKPVLDPAITQQFNEGITVKLIHKTTSFRHYITLDTDNNLSWQDSEGGTSTLLRAFSDKEIYQVTSIGNTLIALASDGMHYFLWKEEETAYMYLGNKMPNLNIVFGLQAESVLYSKKYPNEDLNISLGCTVTYTLNLDSGIRTCDASESTINSWTGSVLAKVNKLINEQVTKKTKFIYPFFVRYAYRLYDGSLTMHSAPILMIPSTYDAPIVKVNETTMTYMTSWNIDVVAFPCSLSYQVFNKEVLNGWSDIIYSVEVFISLPIWRYDQSGKVGLIKGIPEGYSIVKYTGGDLGAIDGLGDYYAYVDMSRLCKNLYDLGNFGSFRLPLFDKKQYDEKLCSCANFYHIASIKLGKLATTDSLVPFEIEDLNSLSVREVMTDDYQSNDTIVPKYSFVYNSRLNITSIQRRYFDGFNPSSMLCRSEKSVFEYNTQEIAAPAKIEVYVKINGKYNKTESLYSHAAPLSYTDESGNYSIKSFYPNANFIFYPDTNATEMIIHQEGYGIVKYTLSPHPTLNGSYYFSGLESRMSIIEVTIPEVSDGIFLDISNKIYTSEVNNPFYFPLLGINTVGTGDIIGISAAAKALSEGQFGQFPLYAFTTEGVWALEVSSTGTYSAKQPITRDVCINPDSITQIDTAVLFATDRGIMHISGSTTECISDNISTDNLSQEDLFNITDLPKADKLIEIFNAKADATGQIDIQDVTILPFRQFLTDCRMIYDYINQRIIVYNPSVSYAYVYSMKSKTWGMMRSTIVDNVNAYPEALVMGTSQTTITAEDGTTTTENVHGLLNLSESVAQNTTALIVTRPFKLDSPDTFKTINTIIQRGVFRSDHVQQVLYGSNDLLHWHTVWSSVDKIMRGFRGTPYKAYRLALICRFDKGESIYGCTVVYEPRQTNQVR